MRDLRRFNRPQLQARVDGLTQTNADKFIRSIYRAGYLRVVQAEVSGRPGSFRQYKLIRDTGPQCPVCWIDGRVYDQNTKQTFGKDGALIESPASPIPGSRAKLIASPVRARAWQSMRIMRRFTRPQIQTTSSINSTNADKFIRALQRAGYLRIVQPAVNGQPGSFNVYQLVRDTGPLCPVCWTDGQVYDQNTKQIHGSASNG